MMMSMAGEKGSTEFNRPRRTMAILPASSPARPISSIVHCDRAFRIVTAGAGP